MTKKILIQDAPTEGNFTKEEIKNAILEAKKAQYKNTGEVAHIKHKDPQDKKNSDFESQISSLKERIDTQYKVIDKLVRDVKRMKDQISELAGKIPRG